MTLPRYTPAEVVLGAKLKRLGIVNPLLTIRAAKAAKLPLALACAFLEQESGGGRNVFGHDPTIFVGAGAVTKAKYLAYKAKRRASGNRQMQGVGPMQLTWWTFQDAADAEGGCWMPYANMLIGFRLAAEKIRRYGMVEGIKAYNGSGPAADRYSASVRARADKWALKLKAPKRPVALNPKAFLTGDVDVSRDLQVRLARVARDLKVKVHITSGRRSYAEQQVLYRRYLRYGRPLAARPGTSRHETADAADCAVGGRNIGDFPGARAALKRHGLCLPVPGETWHVEKGDNWRA